MDIVNVKDGEKQGYLFLIISPALIGVVAFLFSLSAEVVVQTKVLLCMIVCLLVSLYFALQYRTEAAGGNKRELFSVKELYEKEAFAKTFPDKES